MSQRSRCAARQATAQHPPLAVRPLTLALHLTLAGAAGLAGWAPAALAQGAATVPATAPTHSYDTITVTASGTQDDYAGGEVARRGRIGILGSSDIMDTPFNVTNYTQDTIENWGAGTVREVLNNDPSVRFTAPEGHAEGDYTIRGFNVLSQDMMLDGLYGLAPDGRVPTEFIERVEVFRGPNAMIGGMSPNGSVGGTINLAPKRATDAPILDLTADYATDAQVGGHIDVGRRFGDEQQFGVRFNGLYSDGDTFLDGQQRQRGLGALALDYRKGPLRGSVDAYHTDEKIENGNTVGIIFDHSGAVTGRLPKAPDGSVNQRLGIDGQQKNRGVVGRIEYDLVPNLTVYAALGALDYKYEGYLRGGCSSAAVNGDCSSYVLNQPGYADTASGETGLRGTFETGPLTHQIVAAATLLDYESGSLTRVATQNSNFYHPNPAITLSADPGNNPPKTSEKHLVGYAIADTMSMLDDRLLVTAGVRQQQVEQKSWNGTTGAQTADYDESRLTPSVAVVVKPFGQRFSLYANYIEGLQAGMQVGTLYKNAGEVFKPYVSKQYEAGAKADWDGFGASLSVFQIKQPSTISIESSDPGELPTLALDGEQRNRGIELNTYGELGEHLRLLGGVMFIDAEQLNTAGGAHDGKTARGVPHTSINLGADWDLPWLPKLTLGGRVIHTSSQYANSANTTSIPAWTRVDANLRYSFAIGGRKVELRGVVTNLFDKTYWNNVYGEDAVNAGAPRMATLSATVHF